MATYVIFARDAEGRKILLYVDAADEKEAWDSAMEIKRVKKIISVHSIDE